MKNNHDYEQLSTDWRHRDQLTWQIPSVLIAVSGALITVVLQLDQLADVRYHLLWGGLLFSGLLTIALGQNLYYQTVTEDLMDAIREGETVKGDRIPKRRENGPLFRTLMKSNLLKTGSTGLFLLSAGLTGFIGLLISDLQFQSETNFILWIEIVILIVVLTIFINLMTYNIHKQSSTLSKKEEGGQ